MIQKLPKLSYWEQLEYEVAYATDRIKIYDDKFHDMEITIESMRELIKVCVADIKKLERQVSEMK